jgi:hypothetical protein
MRGQETIRDSTPLYSTNEKQALTMIKYVMLEVATHNDMNNLNHEGH